jgi:Zn-finger nucleic acid-binding protein
MLFSHDCENEIVHRERPGQPDSCDNCYSVWLHNKSFKRILKKMDRYTAIEDILRHSWRWLLLAFSQSSYLGD